jgi:hypothetical protein
MQNISTNKITQGNFAKYYMIRNANTMPEVRSELKLEFETKKQVSNNLGYKLS